MGETALSRRALQKPEVLRTITCVVLSINFHMSTGFSYTALNLNSLVLQLQIDTKHARMRCCLVVELL
jgi:hypothetical protein